MKRFFMVRPCIKDMGSLRSGINIPSWYWGKSLKVKRRVGDKRPLIYLQDMRSIELGDHGEVAVTTQRGRLGGNIAPEQLRKGRKRVFDGSSLGAQGRKPLRPGGAGVSDGIPAIM